jgi:hypothetical protein
MTDRPQKITFAQMRSSGVRGILVYCSDYRCSHSVALRADRWADDVRLSDIEPRFVCKVCGKGGADVPAGFQLAGSAKKDDGVSIVWLIRKMAMIGAAF